MNSKKQISKLIEKESRFVLTGGRGGVGKLNEGGQKVQTSNYSINNC